MTKNVSMVNNKQKEVSEKDIDSLFDKVKRFQQENQKYLIKMPDATSDVKPTIINMVNTNY